MPNCAPGQRYSTLLQSCVADPSASNTGTNVPVNAGGAVNNPGGFWSGENIGNYADAFASVWNAVSGNQTQPIYVTQTAPAQTESKNNIGIIIAVVVAILLLLLVVLLARRKK